MWLFVKDEGKVCYAGPYREGSDVTGVKVHPDDLKSMADAETLAADATRDLAPRQFIAVDEGSGVSPRFRVMEAYKVGDKVGFSFNGDRYPDGEIVRISTSGRVITTSTGKRYYRRGQTMRWMQTGGTWCLSLGHHEARNPHF